MLLTVHDEIVFEIKHDRVGEAVPIIVEIMERPSKMAGWRVPLVTEPLVGPNWGTGYKCERYVEGKTKQHEGDKLVNGFLYGTIREVDLGKERPEAGEEEVSRNEDKKKLKIRILEPAWLRNISEKPSDDVGGPSVAVPASPDSPKVEVKVEAPGSVAAPAAPEPPKAKGQVVKLKIHKLTEGTVLQVYHAIIDAEDQENGKLLELQDHVGTPIIETSVGIKVNAPKLAEILAKKYNIGDGGFRDGN